MRSAPSPAPNEAPPNAAPAESTAQRPMAIALAGMVALAVAMGIGRFAFTPLLPMMLHDGLLDLPGASWLASANYFGYLVGAVLCTLQPWLWARLRVLPLFAVMPMPSHSRSYISLAVKSLSFLKIRPLEDRF